MYHVPSIGFIAILLYLISYLFYRIKYYNLQFHRKLWNSLLAVTFLITAIAGLFMALQTNYKWDIPVIKTILKWHVEFGIGLAFTGLFHLIWHLSYFTKIFNKPEVNPEEKDFPVLTSDEMTTNLFMVGFVSSSFQLLLIREMMNISGGYELIAGTFLGSWLISSAIGAYFAGRSPLNDIRKINLVFAISPIISMFMLFLLSRMLLNTGETPSFLLSMIYTFLVLIPFCLVSGFTFIKLISIAKPGNNFVPGKSFSIETAGGVVSGILISVLTAGLLNSYQLILLIILTSVAYVLLTFFLNSGKTKIFFKLFIAAVAASIIIFNPDVFFRHLLLSGINVTSSRDTPYGNITEGNYQGEQSIYYNQRLISYNDDAIEREEDIHYAMLQCEYPEKVILISGPLQSYLPEISKYPVKKLIFIERDPALARRLTYLINEFKGELEIANNDAYRYIKNSREMVDAIILLIPPPSTLLLNRYYSTEFFIEVKKRLNPGGVFMCSPGPGDTYFNKESLNLYSSIHNSLASVFQTVKPVVGNKLYLIASDKDISVSFCKLTEQRNIKNIYISPDYLADDLIKNKSDEVNSLFDPDIKQNRYAFPYACFYLQSYNFSKNINEKTLSIVLMIIIFAAPLLAIKRTNLLMYFSASALAGFEIIILLTLQLIIGNMYQLTGLIIAGLMSGLALGALLDIGFLNGITLRMKGLILMVFYIGFGLLFNHILALKYAIPSLAIIILSSFLPALLTGHLFRELTLKSDESSHPSKVYSADLAGSALGFILISGFMVPLFGIKVSIFLLSILIFTGIVFGTIRNK